jgi:hypothetical protein
MSNADPSSNRAADRTPPTAPVDATLLGEAGQALDAAVALRRRIHTRPETGLDLPITQEVDHGRA